MYSKTGKWMSKLLLTGAMFLSLSALSEGALQSHMKAFVVTPQDDGSESFEVAKSVEPGQVIEYRTVYTNTGESMIAGLAVVGPVPHGTRYLGESAFSNATHAFEASIDGGNSWHNEPLVRMVRQPDGSDKQVVVPPEEYTHVRWKTSDSIASNSSQEYRYRVFVVPAENNAK